MSTQVMSLRRYHKIAVPFNTTIFQAEGMQATGIRVPVEAVAALGAGKRPKVKVTLNWYSYRSTAAAYGDQFLLPFSAVHRGASGFGAGDEVEVTLELDVEPRTVEVPDVQRAALVKAGALEAFEALAFLRRKEFVRQVNDAKQEETRERRIAKIVASLSD